MGRILFLALLALPLLAHAEAPSVRLSTLEWPPYVGTQLPQQGYAYAVVSEAFAKSGQRTSIRFYPWARALKLAEQGTIDGVFPEYFAPALRPDMLFSDPFPGGPAGLLKLRKRPFAFAADPQLDGEQAFAALEGLRLGLVRGYINHPVLDNHPLIKRSYAVDDLQNLNKLLAQRVDLIFIDFKVAQYLIDLNFPDRKAEFEALQPALLRPTLHLIMPRRNSMAAAQMAAFNQGLQALKDSGELEALLHSHGLQ